MQKKIEDIIDILNKNGCYSNSITHNTKKSLILTFGYEFEPHGRASEDFEAVWKIEIPYIHYYWKGTKGWVKGNPDLCYGYYDKDYQTVIDRTIDFLAECEFEVRKIPVGEVYD